MKTEKAVSGKNEKDPSRKRKRENEEEHSTSSRSSKQQKRSLILAKDRKDKANRTEESLKAKLLAEKNIKKERQPGRTNT